MITCWNSGSLNKQHDDEFENQISRSGWRGSSCGTNSSLERQDQENNLNPSGNYMYQLLWALRNSGSCHTSHFLMSFIWYWQQIQTIFINSVKQLDFLMDKDTISGSQSTKHSRKVCTPWGTLNLGIWWRWPLNQKLDRPQSWSGKSGEGRTQGSEPQSSSSKLFTGQSQVIPGTKSIYNRQSKICDIW